MEYLIGDISRETGFGIHTLRFYEKKKLIFPNRDYRNRRIYSENDLLRLKILKNFKVIGTSLKDIELYFNLFDKSNEGREERKKFLLVEKDKIYLQIKHLKTVEEFIDDILIKCHLLE